jgi:hypothetical protein
VGEVKGEIRWLVSGGICTGCAFEEKGDTLRERSWLYGLEEEEWYGEGRSKNASKEGRGFDDGEEEGRRLDWREEEWNGILRYI